jgi:hypothetical protein
MLRNCCSFNVDLEENLKKYLHLRKQEDATKFMERQQFSIERRKILSQEQNQKPQERKILLENKKRSSSAPVFGSNHFNYQQQRQQQLFTSTVPTARFSSSAPRMISPKPAFGSSTPRPIVIGSSSIQQNHQQPQRIIIERNQIQHHRRGAADMARDYLRREENLRKMRAEREAKEKEEFTFVPKVRTYFSASRQNQNEGVVVRSSSSSCLNSFSRRGSALSQNQQVRSSSVSSSNLPPLPTQTKINKIKKFDDAQDENEDEQKEKEINKKQKKPVGSVLANLDKYMLALQQRNERLEEMRQKTKEEKERKELEQCSFTPKITGMPIFIQRMIKK